MLLKALDSVQMLNLVSEVCFSGNVTLGLMCPVLGSGDIGVRRMNLFVFSFVAESILWSE